jgi:hypothetical protein
MDEKGRLNKRTGAMEQLEVMNCFRRVGVSASRGGVAFGKERRGLGMSRADLC